MYKNLSALLIASIMAPSAFAQTLSLEERVSELEANQSLNIFKFSGIFQTRYDDLVVEQDDPTILPDYGHLDYLRLRVSLNVDADVNKYIKFYSRFTTTKNFNTWTAQGSANPLGPDLAAADDYSGSQVVLEKAYADMNIPGSNFTITVGRLPTVDGEPTNYYDGRARMGTYPLMTYNAPLDGFALTYRVDEYMPKDHKLALRAIYSPFTSYSKGTTGQGAYTTPAKQNGNKINTLTDLTAVQFDYSTSAWSGFADTFGVIVQYYQSGNLPYTLTATSTLTLAPSATAAVVSMNGIAGSGWDLSLSYLMSKVHSEGFINVGAGNQGFGTLEEDDDVTGNIGLLSTRYRWSSWIFGAEYVVGSQDSFYYSPASDDLTGFYATAGDAYHLYVTKKFTDTVSLRAGCMQQKYKYTSLTLGETADSDKEIKTGYANLRMDF